MSEKKVLLLDDEKDSLIYSYDALKNYVKEEDIIAVSTISEAVSCLKGNDVYVAFLDIELSYGNGFQLTEFIHENYPDIKVVILTGHVDLAYKSFDYEPFDFLCKPVDLLRLNKTFKKLASSETIRTNEKIMIETSGGFVMITPEDVEYISKEKYGVELHCFDNKVYRVNYTLEHLEAVFGKYGFFRTHQSYLVSTDLINNVRSSRFGTSYEALLKDGTIVPVSRGKYSKLKEYLVKRSIQLV